MNERVLAGPERSAFASPASERRKHSRVAVAQVFLLAVGLAIMAGLIWQVGPEEILVHLRPLGWTIGFTWLPYLLVLLLDSLGWRYAFDRPIPPALAGLTLIHIIGKAVNLITPLVPIGGEPLKAHLLSTRGVPLTEGLASVVISRTVATIAQGLFVAAVTAFTFFSLGIAVPLLKAVLGVVGVGVVLVGAFLLTQIRGLFAGILGITGWLRIKLSFLEDGARDLDRRISRYYLHQPRRLSSSLTFHFLSWLAEGLEVYVLLALLDLPRSPALALALAAFSSTIRAASFAVPASLGIQEGGSVFLFVSFGLPPGAAMAFSILRRLREIAWSAVGLILLSWHAPGQRIPVGAMSPGAR